jgi:hypothetical protein
VQCIGSIRKLGGFAMVDDWNPSMGFTDVVLFGLNEDLPLALTKALALYPNAIKNHNVWTQNSLNLPMRIEWGKLIPIPELVKILIETYEAK